MTRVLPILAMGRLRLKAEPPLTATKQPRARGLKRKEKMKTVRQMVALLRRPGEYGNYHSTERFDRYAMMVGWQGAGDPEYDSTDVPAEIGAQIMRLDYAERATDTLAEMGRQIGKVSVSVPSNINVWQHLKGEGGLSQAASSLAEAAKAIADLR